MLVETTIPNPAFTPDAPDDVPEELTVLVNAICIAAANPATNEGPTFDIAGVELADGEPAPGVVTLAVGLWASNPLSALYAQLEEALNDQASEMFAQRRAVD